MIYTVRINDKDYEVEVERGKASVLNVTQATPQPTAPSVQAPVAAPAAPANQPAQEISAGAKTVVAPMPGTVLNIKTAVGARVKSGDVLLVLEAMKMENDIAAPVDGVVSQILVAKGSSVNTDDVLITIQ
ncbi:MAG: biotin/lipoyl-containing protein [bacterium]|nr:biotin/lipoyl-containing protein [bacterium]